MTREYLPPSEQEAILDKGLVHLKRGIRLKSGRLTKTKFEFDNIEDESLEFSFILNGMTALIKERMRRAEAIVSVPDGATRLGEALGERLGLPHLKSTKTPDDRIGFHVEANFERRQTSTVLIDDVYTAGTNLNEMGRAAYAAGLFVIGGIVILDRSDHPQPTFMAPDNIRLHVNSLIKHPIPTY
jgi:orotate phosphoribosyltransferase